MTAARRRRLLGGTLAVAGLVVLLLASRPQQSDAAERRYGVSAADGDPGIAIHWVICAGERARVVSLGGYVGGSSPGEDVPVFWQIRSDAEPAATAGVATFVVGSTPEDFYETIRYRGGLPDDLIVIDGPPGGSQSMNGMSFEISSLTDRVLRGTYDDVSIEQFESDGLASCKSTVQLPTSFNDVGFVALGLGGVLVGGRRWPTLSFVAAVVVLVGASGFVPLRRATVSDIAAPTQPPAAFRPGAAVAPPDRRVLLELSDRSPTAAGVRDAAIGRIFATGPYSFVVECDGPSIQVGEGAGLENGSTGSRQIIGCATPEPVRGAIGDRRDRSDVVEIVVNPNGMTHWRVLVIDGAGSVGPFND